MRQHRRACELALVMSLCLLSVSSVSAVKGGPSNLNIVVSRIDTVAPVPYLEMEALNYQTIVYGPNPIEWLWLSSSREQGPRQEISTPILVQENNESVPVAQSLVRLETYPAERGAVSPRWILVPRNEYTYAFGFMVAFNDSVTFEKPSVFLSFNNRNLEDEWTYDQTFARFDTLPDNATLSHWGLNPSDFAQYSTYYHYKTFYLYQITFSKNSYFVERLSLTFEYPAIALLILLAVSITLLLFGKLSLGNALTLYLGSAFFSLPFLLNYAQLAFGQVSFTEKLFYYDIYIAMGLAAVSLFLRLVGKTDDETIIQFLTRRKHPVKEAHSKTHAA